MCRKLIILALTASAICSAPLLAGEIYKFVDSEGNVHYVDRPSGESGEERLGISYARTDNATVQSEIQRRRDYETSQQERRAANDERETEQAQARLDADERAAKCQEQRSRLESYLQSRRLYRENAQGEREYLDESETLAARQKVEEQIQEYCS